MNKLRYTLTLISDGEPASGLGSGLIDGLLPRDFKGRIIIPAAHIKGLIRENLTRLSHEIVPPQAVVALFGQEGSDPRGGALVHFSDAVAPEDTAAFAVTRTALNPHGTARGSSLRSGEAVAAGTVFSGTLTWHSRLQPPFKALLRLGLLSVFAVGANRRRGAGACIVAVEGEDDTPGRVLEGLDSKGLLKPALAEAPGVFTGESRTRPVFVKLKFRAHGPVCVPQTPVVANNTITTGFTIPASAVQGALLHRLSDMDDNLATACFESENFRTWPLNPAPDDKGFSFGVPNTVKISKKKEKSRFLFFDPAAGRDYPDDIALKTPSGILHAADEDVQLWQARDMARIITAHGVHNHYNKKGELKQDRNLFTVEALSPTLFVGLAAVPEDICEHLLKSLEQDPFARLGKARSVRGGGDLTAEVITPDALCFGHSAAPKVFITQSPVMVGEPAAFSPAAGGVPSARRVLENLVADTGLGRAEKSWATFDIRFGWNRTRDRDRNRDGRIAPSRVIPPGAVFSMTTGPDDLAGFLVKGIGGKKQQGFGAVLPHPGLVNRLYEPETALRQVNPARHRYASLGYALWQKVEKAGLSKSQISQVRDMALARPAEALYFLDRQRRDRPDRIWERWKPVFTEISKGIKERPGETTKELKVCLDLMGPKGERE